jgi:hypothetical protein
MLTGRRAFRGDSAVETMNAIFTDDPAPTGDHGRPPRPPAVDRLVLHCFEKNPRSASSRPATWRWPSSRCPDSRVTSRSTAGSPHAGAGLVSDPLWLAVPRGSTETRSPVPSPRVASRGLRGARTQGSRRLRTKRTAAHGKGPEQGPENRGPKWVQPAKPSRFQPAREPNAAPRRRHDQRLLGPRNVRCIAGVGAA